jgi:aspartyl/asparaginyl beta-hydroxylase (cupin superfamily)
MIQALPHRFDVSQAVKELDACTAWNVHRQRTAMYVHGGLSDVWVRYNDFENFTGDWDAFNGPHESVWYPVIRELPAVWSLVRKLKRATGKSELGGVLVTRIPPGGEVKAHVDGGWHAGHYEKFAVQLKSAPGQMFHFEDSQLNAAPGESYTFDNSKLHWVTNPTDAERMTLIVCLR